MIATPGSYEDGLIRGLNPLIFYEQIVIPPNINQIINKTLKSNNFLSCIFYYVFIRYVNFSPGSSGRLSSIENL